MSRSFIQSLSGCRGTPRMLRISPINAVQHISELRHRDRNDAVRGRWPDEPAALQPLGVERHAQPIVPENFDELAALSAEHVEIAAVRITLEGFLHQQSQRVHAATHVSVAGRDPHTYPGRNRDHRRRPAASTASTAAKVAASTAPVTRIRVPVANSISIAPGPGRPAGTCSGAIRTAAKPVREATRNWRRQPYSWPG